MLEHAAEHPIRCVDGRVCIGYDGCWIRYYAPPKDSLGAKVDMIRQLTRRAFHHSEVGINTPGINLDSAREAFETAIEPEIKRVNAAMLAGALLNRVSDTLALLLQLEQKNVSIDRNSDILKCCEEQLAEAMELGKQIRHVSGLPGVAELWGEPLHAFCLPVADFYDSRYRKIAMTQQAINAVCDKLCALIAKHRRELAQFRELVSCYAKAAIQVSETMKSDPVFFKVWPEFVACCDRLNAAIDEFQSHPSVQCDAPLALIQRSRDLIGWMASLRVPMEEPVSDLCARIDALATP